MDLHWIIIGPLAAALVAPWMVRLAGSRAARPAAGGGAVRHRRMAAPPGRGRGPGREWSHPWLPALGVDLAFRVGGFERLFLFLVSFIGGLICIYGGAYLDGDKKVARFFVIVLLFMAAMLGVIAADDIILTFVFWELTSLTSFLLVGYKHYDTAARKAALQALLVTGAGGLALLAGLILLTQITGGNPHIGAGCALGTDCGEYAIRAGVVAGGLAGVFTKSAQVPFHFWLPGAMAAPTPVSAYLHSATMVKAGVILLAKLSPTAMSQTEFWGWIVAPVGALTMVTGAAMAVFQTDLKRLLAFSTVSILGTLVMLLGFGDAFSFKTAMFLALVHGFYKGALFMVAGTVDHAPPAPAMCARSPACGRACHGWDSRHVRRARSAMSGVPPTLGFISKELL